MKTGSPQIAWWSAGDQFCQFCQELYLLEAEVRCVECDRGVCPMCAVFVRVEALRLCPHCHTEADKTAN